MSSHDHSHAHATSATGPRLGLAALLTGGFMLAEIAGGVLSGSLALIADAGHMVTDFAALALAWFAARLAVRPADWKRTYGFDRFSVLVAFVNGIALFVIAGLIVVEAARRLFEPVEVAGPLMLVVAAAGLGVNIAAFLILRGADQRNLNVRGAAIHVMGDLLGSLAAILAAVIIVFTGWSMADPLLSAAVAVLIVRSAWIVVRDAAAILLEAAPADFDSRRIAADLVANVPGVEGIHHVHAWSISEQRPMLTLHARAAAGPRPEAVAAAVKQRLRDHFGIGHATVEVEFHDCADDPVEVADAIGPKPPAKP
ncbi:MAG TPA: cation diffusion facilitator family transporter [Devosiaceae bacterium]|nr:cation diffusion facilitator family transporter [Devosiaceae bacterium]